MFPTWLWITGMKKRGQCGDEDAENQDIPRNSPNAIGSLAIENGRGEAYSQLAVSDHAGYSPSNKAERHREARLREQGASAQGVKPRTEELSSYGFSL